MTSAARHGGKNQEQDDGKILVENGGEKEPIQNSRKDQKMAKSKN